MAKKSVAAKKKNVAAKPMPKKSRMAAKAKNKKKRGWAGKENLMKWMDAIRMGDTSYFCMTFICQLLLKIDGEEVEGLENCTAQSLESTHGKGTFAITNPNDWGKNFNLGRDNRKKKKGKARKESPTSSLINKLNKNTFVLLNESDGYYENDDIKKNEIYTSTQCRIVVRHVPQYSKVRKRNVQVHDDMSEEEALAIRDFGQENPQPAYDKLNKIKFRVTKKSKGKKDIITEVDSTTKVSKEVNGGIEHRAMRNYVQSNVYKKFVDSLRDSSRPAKCLLWPVGNPTHYVSQKGILKQEIPKEMENYYKIECFI